jgi:pyruvate dehydrogenase E2 component (dihydrolipoamide acetyltransferase)
MATPVEVPKLGNTVEECLIAKWIKHKGDAVSAGDVVAEIETDKATFEVTAPVAGTLLETFFEAGALVPVFTNLFVIGEPGENIDALRPKQDTAAPAAASGKSAQAGAPPASAPTQATPAARAEAPQAAPEAAPAGAWSPRARRFAEEHGFQPSSVAGSGPGGRVLEQDVRDLFFSSPRVSPTARQAIAEGAGVPAVGSGVGGLVLSTDLGPPAEAISRIRERIAHRMRESLASTAQYTLNTSAVATGLLALRSRVKASGIEPNININDLVAFCVIKAVLEFPDVNAEFINGKIVKHTDVNLGFACDTPRGLMVPVVHGAHRMTVGELAVRMKELTTQAVGGAISPDDLSGATFTISNLGGLGIESFSPLINPPQVTILGVNAIQLKPVRKDWGIEFVDFIGLSLTCDHQIVDGAPGARFLKVLREKIEKVESLCMI